MSTSQDRSREVSSKFVVFEELIDALREAKEANPNRSVYNLLKDAAIFHGWTFNGEYLTNLSDSQYLDAINNYNRTHVWQRKKK